MDDNDLPANFNKGQVCEDVCRADADHDPGDHHRSFHVLTAWNERDNSMLGIRLPAHKPDAQRLTKDLKPMRSEG